MKWQFWNEISPRKALKEQELYKERARDKITKSHMQGWGFKFSQKSVTYYLNNPFIIFWQDNFFYPNVSLLLHDNMKTRIVPIHLPIVMADCCGISMAISFRLWTYLTRSRTGMRTLTPGSSVLWNFPIRSTTQASCCGTNMTTVFSGVLWRHRTGALCGRAALNCSWPRTDKVWKKRTKNVTSGST